MDNVKQLSELVGGNVEHLNTLIRKIDGIRRIIHEFKDCEDEVAMKKRYLQVRVQRAAEKQSCLSDSEMRLKLEHARNELILRLRGNDQTISTLKRRIQRKHLQRIALESLSHQAHLQKELIYSSNERLAHFFETEPCRNEDIPPPSLIVSLKDHCDQLKECFTAHTEYTKGLPPSLLQHGSFTLLRALWNYLSEIQSTVDMINDITIMDDGNFENVKNIQKVVLELAKILILLKDDNKREEVMAKLEGLHVREQTGSELEDEIDLNVLGRVISNQRKLENQLEEMVNSCRNELQDLATSAGGIIQSMNDLPEILEKITIKVQTDQTVESSLLDRHYPSRREEILIRHCIRPQLSDIPKLITDQCKFEELLLKGLIETTRSISGQKEEFQRRTDYFTSECLSIEKLERTEYQQALQHGR